MLETVLFWAVYVLAGWKITRDVWNATLRSELFALAVTLVVVAPVAAVLVLAS